MNIERGPRKERGFVILDNALAQNRALSFGARGLAAYILSLPPGARADIKTLAAENPEGRTAIAGYMRELEEARLLVRTTRQGERGRFITTCTLYEEPQDPESMPPSLAKPWSKAKARSGASSQVGPKTAKPNFGQPNPGRPNFGQTDFTPFGGKEPRERTTPYRPPANEPDAVPAPRAGGGGGAAPEERGDDAAFVDALPYRGRTPGRKTREHLIARVAAAFAAGWTPEALRGYLTDGTDTAKSLAAVYRHRMDPGELPDAPAARPVTTAVPMQGCEECGRGFRAPEPGLCRDCREREPVPA